MYLVSVTWIYVFLSTFLVSPCLSFVSITANIFKAKRKSLMLALFKGNDTAAERQYQLLLNSRALFIKLGFLSEKVQCGSKDRFMLIFQIRSFCLLRKSAFKFLAWKLLLSPYTVDVKLFNTLYDTSPVGWGSRIH